VDRTSLASCSSFENIQCQGSPHIPFGVAGEDEGLSNVELIAPQDRHTGGQAFAYEFLRIENGPARNPILAGVVNLRTDRVDLREKLPHA
jgi:hypothetical protein